LEASYTFSMNSQESEYRIVELAGFDAVGLRTECPGSDISSIGKLWEDFFGAKSREVEGSLGIVGVSWSNGSGGFSYMAAHKLAAGTGVARDGYESRSVPGGKYIGLQWAGKGGGEMSAAFQELFCKIIPSAGLVMHPQGCCVEDYPEHAYDPKTQTLRAELLVRVTD
jgi:predicted transcriptional regulator YdeE